jgi:hypothetical protein
LNTNPQIVLGEKEKTPTWLGGNVGATGAVFQRVTKATQQVYPISRKTPGDCFTFGAQLLFKLRNI